ncbi:unnamed protein product [Fusarium graminearum]|uniref:Chromosome 4, complete genome n=1 Tax=Gibberella zeae (strain ATCC MYA-4620 / CBS 123657 / FGSC 9075 / NRRL 31084 / PH-1) TaxID=229533 RepID=A0A098DN14_GIBZE|nr:unnamed protein product [Fusarium graminearum]
MLGGRNWNWLWPNLCIPTHVSPDTEVKMERLEAFIMCFKSLNSIMSLYHEGGVLIDVAGDYLRSLMRDPQGLEGLYLINCLMNRGIDSQFLEKIITLNVWRLKCMKKDNHLGGHVFVRQVCRVFEEILSTFVIAVDRLTRLNKG